MQYYTMNHNGKEKVKGRRVRFKEYPELDLFYYRTKYYHYFICELESGASIAMADQLKNAKERALLNIKSRGLKFIRAGIKTNIKKYGRANEVKSCK